MQCSARRCTWPVEAMQYSARQALYLACGGDAVQRQALYLACGGGPVQHQALYCTWPAQPWDMKTCCNELTIQRTSNVVVHEKC